MLVERLFFLTCTLREEIIYMDVILISFLVKELTIHSKIYGLAYGEEKFYVACVTEVKILNVKGESVHVIRVPNACIRQVCTDKGRLYFSDWNHNSIQVRGVATMLKNFIHNLVRFDHKRKWHVNSLQESVKVFCGLAFLDFRFCGFLFHRKQASRQRIPL